MIFSLKQIYHNKFNLFYCNSFLFDYNLGLLIGPLLKKYSYRQVAFFGSLLSCTGLILTSRANSMFHIVCTYSILGGMKTR